MSSYISHQCYYSEVQLEYYIEMSAYDWKTRLLFFFFSKALEVKQ